MKNICLRFILFICLSTGPSPLFGQCGDNILVNAGFENPEFDDYGHNFTDHVDGWVLYPTLFNIIKLNGPYFSGPDLAKDGTQYLDAVSGAGTLYQDFSITGHSTPIMFGGYFSSREWADWYDPFEVSIGIYLLPSHKLIGRSSTKIFTRDDGLYPAQEAWHLVNGFATLRPGRYRFELELPDFANFDAAFVRTDCILPLHLSFFSGELTGNAVLLQWKCDDPPGISHFEVERSIDGNTFSNIGSILPSGQLTYTFNDVHITHGTTYYYRLKWVDKDGKVNYSTIIRVYSENNQALLVGPNPATDHLNISGMEKGGWIRVSDMSGGTVIKRQVYSNALSLDISSLAKGLYLLEYSGEMQKHSVKILKQ